MRKLDPGLGGVEAACALLARGELVALPTETVYGLAADATNPAAVAAIFAAKGRPAHNPLIIHVADLAAAEALGRFDNLSRALANAFWPGPLTLVLDIVPDCSIVDLARPGGQTLAVRVPAHALFQAVLKHLGRPLAAPSANPSGGLSPTTADHVQSGLEGKIAAVLDGGPCPVGLESTVVQVKDGIAHILRPGGLTRDRIEAVAGPIGPEPLDVLAKHLSSPGQLLSHYAPRAQVRLNAAQMRPGEALLAFGPDVPQKLGPVLNLSFKADVTEAAARLFDYLKRLDETGVATIAVMPIPDQGLGEAINDRLKRAAADRGR
jgi:L-threonylcarbamoyladenylate synthase